MSEPQENRVFSRIVFDAKTIISNADQEWETNLIDISLKGALLDKPETWNASKGDEFKLVIMLSEDTCIFMEASVAHEENDHIGFACHHIDLESITHLRRIVELNTGNDELLNRELSALKR